MTIWLDDTLESEADFVGVDCLDDDTVVALAEGVLEGEAREAALVHLESCETCSALVGQAARLGSHDRPSLGRYRMIEQIGAGGMGRVYLAYDPALDRELALKLVEIDALERDVGSARLRKEAQTLAALDHPALCKVFDVQQQDEIVFIAMELVRGRTFASWLATRPEPTAIVDVFVRAGEGLAAAHEAGVVHRDFKPTNAMVDDASGRVVVLDFGLARRERVVEITISDAVTTMDVGRRTGSAFAGTPIYMAPEQHEGMATAASDQYAFCLVLLEALARRFPFADEVSAAALHRAKRKRALVEGITDGLPTHVRKVVLRGLEPDADARFPDMRALLEVLRAPARKRWPIAAAASAFAALAAVALYLGTRSPAVDCDRADERVTEVWSDARRTAVHDAFVHSGASESSALATRVQSELDDHAQALAGAYRDACRSRLDHADALFDARARCLDRRVRELDAAVGALRELDAKTATASFSVVDELTDAARCRDDDFLLAMSPMPDDPRTAAAVEALQRRLDAAEGELHVGRDRDAVPLLERVVEEARALEHEPLLADALAGFATALRRIDDPRADAIAEEAHGRARLVRDDASAARAAIQLVLLKRRRGELIEAQKWIEEAQRDVEKANVPKLRAHVLAARAAIAYAKHDFPQALALHRESVQIHAEIDPRGEAYAVGLRDVANTLLRMNRFDEAIATLVLARSLLIDRVGVESASVAEIESELAMVYVVIGHPQEAVRYYERGLPIIERHEGARSRSVFSLRARLATAYLQAGRIDDAIEESREVIALLDHIDHSPREAAVTWMSLAMAQTQKGDLARALEAYEKARGIIDAADEEAPLLGLLVHNLQDSAKLLDRLERTDEAETLRKRVEALTKAK